MLKYAEERKERLEEAERVERERRAKMATDGQEREKLKVEGTNAASSRSAEQPLPHAETVPTPSTPSAEDHQQQPPTPIPAPAEPITPDLQSSAPGPVRSTANHTPFVEGPGAAAARSYSGQGSSAPEASEPFVQPLPRGRKGPANRRGRGSRMY